MLKAMKKFHTGSIFLLSCMIRLKFGQLSGALSGTFYEATTPKVISRYALYDGPI